jgi:hypothetical protein
MLIDFTPMDGTKERYAEVDVSADVVAALVEELRAGGANRLANSVQFVSEEHERVSTMVNVAEREVALLGRAARAVAARVDVTDEKWGNLTGLSPA